jgi:uncharacterized membrane protein (Fun14 family)
MFDVGTDPLRWATAHRFFFHHLTIMPGWHKLVILLGGLLAIGGTAGRIAAKPAPDAPAAVTNNAPQSSGSNGLVANTPAAPTAESSGADSGVRLGPLGRISPHAQGVGFSLIVGFIIGWFFRAFLKTMALLMLLVGGGLWLLSHYNILHVSDSSLDAMKEQSGAAVSWLGVQATHFKEMIISHLPSSGGGTFGAFLGLRRR